MEAKKLEIDGLNINFYESEGTDIPIVLVHGNSASGRTFSPQLESDLGKKHRIIALDLPGHGLSDRATDPMATYNMPGYAKTVVGLAKALGVDNAVFAGWSLGGHIVLEAIADLPQAKGFLIYGTPPLGIPPEMDKGFLPNPAMAAALKGDLSQDEVTAFGQSCVKPGDELEPVFFEDMIRTDGRARESLAVSVGTANYRDEIGIVGSLKQPLAILHGEHEQLVNEPYISALKMPTLWRGKVQVVAGAGHTTHREKPAEFNALLADFVKDIS